MCGVHGSSASVGVGRQTVVAVGGDPMVLLARLLRRVDVHHGRLQVAQLVQQAVVDLAGYLVTLCHGRLGVHCDVHLGSQPMAHHRARTSATSSTPSTRAAALRISSITEGSTPSSRRANTIFPDCHTITRIAAAIRSPTMGSASGYPSHTPTAPTNTARLVYPSVLAW